MRLRQDLALAAGVAVLGFVLGPWFDGLSDAYFSWHMVQHFAIMMVAAPLLLLGAPLRRLLSALPRPVARKLSAFVNHPRLDPLRFPVLAWLSMPLVLYVAHFSPLYEAALEHEPIHALEHGAFLVAALIWWNPVLAVAPSPHALSYPVRMFYVFVSMPIQAFLALALYTANHALYPFYVRELGPAAALVDQAYGAEFMWVATGFVLFLAFMGLCVAWLRDERRRTMHADRLLG